jgi:hypothetical protein
MPIGGWKAVKMEREKEEVFEIFLLPFSLVSFDRGSWFPFSFFFFRLTMLGSAVSGVFCAKNDVLSSLLHVLLLISGVVGV